MRHRGASLRLQRALVDFGAEESFARAAQRVREHYGIDVSVWRVRAATLEHARACGAVEKAPPEKAAVLITQMDGSMIPVVKTKAGSADRRKGRSVYWREARLCLARALESKTPVYGVTLAGPQVAGELWREVALSAGLAPQTRVHGVGDGAPWIVEQFGGQFGAQGAYLLDFYHVSEYLAAAAPARQRGPDWLKRQQCYLLANRLGPTLQSLTRRLESPGAKEQPVRAAYRYLNERRAYLDYAGARAGRLPIGSGEIESGHRHVIQKRLKLAGAWWKENNAEAMLTLRAQRASGLWENYWQTLRN